ncbi:hypothetical protein THASP1DRAFT_25195 [Thamnocephalis sphaerospora]|uniref:Chitin-binding type-4 domain-containing protein n=1 Tax=Thamnocephalis sphaerospora TaxID=78915 RepID=A0A4P9XKZ9_9FUNG|nr:hypothetical protein THASP1DRAFT_25195 [Thamnocephalis sphaerospora]|eukprot:RKP06498.1 hypothetical protein THASP1DRAFT_25195 [Thamnocephalis sphaerospora]
MRSILATTLLALTAAAGVSAHGYLSSPPPFGYEKATYQIDDLKSPNNNGLCRGEKPGPVAQVTAGGSLKLGFTITAPHVGPCAVSLLDADLNLASEKQIDTRMDCAAPGKVRDWDVVIPTWASGTMNLRWTWQGCHVQPCEPYEQCVRLQVSGGSGTPTKNGTVAAQGVSTQQPAPTPQPETPAPQPVVPAPQPVVPAPQPVVPAPQPNTPAPSAPATKEPCDDNASTGGAPSKTFPVVSYGGQCAAGAFTCKGDAVGQCSQGRWVYFPCASGTTCTRVGAGAICGHKKAY